MKLFKFPIFRGTFTFRLIPTIITVIMVAGMIGLGVWQVQRLHWKEGLIAEMHERMHQPEIDVGLSVIPPENIPNLDYRPGRATGTFDNGHEFYLNAISINGDGGYDLLTPLTLEDGRVLLVNRGWMPYAKRDQGSGVRDQATGVGDLSVYRPDGPVTVTGILKLPQKEKPTARPDNNAGKNDWYWIDMPAMTAVIGVKELMPYVLEASDAPHDGAWPVGGQTRVELVNHHFQYAITWFWLAFILPFIYFVSNWRLDRVEKPVEIEEKKEGEKTEEKKPV